MFRRPTELESKVNELYTYLQEYKEKFYASGNELYSWRSACDARISKIEQTLKQMQDEVKKKQVEVELSIKHGDEQYQLHDLKDVVCEQSRFFPYSVLVERSDGTKGTYRYQNPEHAYTQAICHNGELQYTVPGMGTITRLPASTWENDHLNPYYRYQQKAAL